MEKKLYLLDAYALIYRAYFSFANNHRYNSKGQNTSAQFGFTNSLIEILNKEKPTHIAVVFDSPGGSPSREDIFAEYKAHREEMPEDIRKAIPDIIKIIEAFNIPVIAKEGFEADDIVGTLAKKAEKEGFQVIMMTPDKDYGQLVSENIKIYKPGRMGNPSEILGVKEICEKFEITNPLQVIDLLGLWGDSVDNIPGIPGVGEKTAKKLIQEYGSIEGVLANADKIAGKLGEKVKANREIALISKQLATIILDVPVELEEDKLIMEKPDTDKVKEIFAELEFRNLTKKVLGEEVSMVTPTSKNGQLNMFQTEIQVTIETTVHEIPPHLVDLKTIENIDHEYHVVNTEKAWELLKKRFQEHTEFCFDTETTSLDEIAAELVGISLSFKKNEAFYIPYSTENSEPNIIETLKPYFEDTKTKKIAQNIKYDLAILKKYGLEIRGEIFDTMIAHYLLMPDMKHNMDLLSETYLQYKPVSIETLIGKKGVNQLNMKDVPLDKISIYAAEDADVTLQLKEIFEPLLAQQKVDKLFKEVEMPLTNVLAEMELEGVNLDVKALQDYSKDLELKLQDLTKKIYDLAGMEFNIDSPKQMGDVLYDKLKIVDKSKKTKTGQHATGEDVLIYLKDKHPIIDEILRFRMFRKLKNTYVDPLPLLLNPQTHRIHTSFMQTIAATGRLSSNNPNLQNIPIKTEDGRQIRKAFIPRDENHVLLSADYSQIELRIIAALSGDKNMQQAFRNKEDIHNATAAKIFGVDPKDVTREMRIKAKAVNFGIIYGQTAFGLSQTIQISRTEAKDIIDSYFKQYPDIKAYIDDSIIKAREQGYVETILGRKRFLKDITSNNATVRGHAERNAINAPIQGSAADIIKMAMIRISAELKKNHFKSKLILQVHDELVLDVQKSEVDAIKALVKENMEHAVQLDVPLEVEVGVGLNWLEAH